MLNLTHEQLTTETNVYFNPIDGLWFAEVAIWVKGTYLLGKSSKGYTSQASAKRQATRFYNQRLPLAQSRLDCGEKYTVYSVSEFTNSNIVTEPIPTEKNQFFGQVDFMINNLIVEGHYTHINSDKMTLHGQSVVCCVIKNMFEIGHIILMVVKD